jgi:putative heme iron utilization protein
MIHESPEDGQDPQALARVSILGNAVEIKPGEERFADAKSAYLEKNPQAHRNFDLGDFMFFEVRLDSVRFVGGFGRIYDLSPEDLRQLSREVD